MHASPMGNPSPDDPFRKEPRPSDYDDPQTYLDDLFAYERQCEQERHQRQKSEASKPTLPVSMSTRLRRLGIAALCLVALLFACFVWPTPYRYEIATVGTPGVIRINRITNNVCMMSSRMNEWRCMNDNHQNEQ